MTNHFATWRSRYLQRHTDREPVTVFVLSGGGLNGAAQAGMIEVLYEAGITPDAMVGVSAGAINAVNIAADPVTALPRLEAAWEWVAEHGIFEAGSPKRLWAVLRQRASLDDGSLLRNALATNLPVTRLEECVIPVRIGTVELLSGEMRWWDTGPALELLTASAAIPGVFPPVNINGQLHVDGGVCSPVPVAAAVEFAPTRIVVCDVSLMSPAESSSSATPSALSVLLRSFDAARRRVMEAEFAAITPDIEVLHIRGGLPGGLEPEAIQHLTEITESGRAAARSALEKLATLPAPARPRATTHSLDLPHRQAPFRATPR